MWIQRIKIDGFRNLDKPDVELTSGTNLFWGANGQGKTNFLEAVYYLLTTKSFKTSQISDCCNYDLSKFRVEGHLNIKGTPWNMAACFDGKKNDRWISQKKAGPLEYIQKGGILVFCSRSRSIVEDSPEGRRKFLDHLISLLDPDYLVLLSQYRHQSLNIKKILRSSNIEIELYNSFKKTILPLAVKLIEKRKNFLKRISQIALPIFMEVFSQSEMPEFRYCIRGCHANEDYDAKFLRVSSSEILYHKQLIGPHLDDLVLTFSGQLAKRSSSSGQIRSVLLAIYFGVRQLYFMKNGCYPLLMLDDFESELDEQRLMRSMEYLTDKGQVLISSTKYAKIYSSGLVNGFEVKNGKIYSLGQMNG